MQSVVLVAGVSADSDEYAAAVARELEKRLRDARMVLWLYAMPFAAIRELRKPDLVVAVIGKDWTLAGYGPRDIREAASGRALIPVLVEGAAPPATDAFRELARRQRPLTLSVANFARDIDVLAEVVRSLLALRTAETIPAPPVIARRRPHSMIALTAGEMAEAVGSVRRARPAPSRDGRGDGKIVAGTGFGGLQRQAEWASVMRDMKEWDKNMARTERASTRKRFPLLPGLGLALVAAVGLGYGLRHGLGALYDWFAAPLFHGTLPPAPAATAATEVADIIAFAPTRAAPGEPFLVQIFVGRTQQDEGAAGIAALAADPTAQKRTIATLDVELAYGDRIDIRLDAPGLDIEEESQSLIWRGQPRACTFLVSAPHDFANAHAVLQARVFRQAVPIGKIAFTMPIEAGAQSEAAAPVGDRSRVFRRAFFSYASPDRAEVVKRAQAFRAANIEFFQDVLSLEPGDRWEQKLYLEIDKCDLFVLFWSNAARDSAWVGKEIQYAIDRIKAQAPPESARPEIHPIILEGPPPPKPPDSLAYLHFNDAYLYVIAALDKMNAARPAD